MWRACRLSLKRAIPIGNNGYNSFSRLKSSSLVVTVYQHRLKSPALGLRPAVGLRLVQAIKQSPFPCFRVGAGAQKGRFSTWRKAAGSRAGNYPRAPYAGFRPPPGVGTAPLRFYHVRT